MTVNAAVDDTRRAKGGEANGDCRTVVPKNNNRQSSSNCLHQRPEKQNTEDESIGAQAGCWADAAAKVVAMAMYGKQPRAIEVLKRVEGRTSQTKRIE